MFFSQRGILGKLPRLSADEIVKVALRGIVVKIVGWSNRMLVFVIRFLFRAAVRWIMGAIAKAPPGLTADRTKTSDGRLSACHYIFSLTLH